MLAVSLPQRQPQSPLLEARQSVLLSGPNCANEIPQVNRANVTEARHSGPNGAIINDRFITRTQNSSVTERLEAKEKIHQTVSSTTESAYEITRPSCIKRKQDPTCGICFDVDGVLAHGTRSIPSAPQALQRLLDSEGKYRLPVIFVTNSLSCREDKARKLSELLGIQVSREQMILAPGPLEMFTDLHEKFCLVVGQGKVLEIATDLGFKNMCTIEDIARSFPLLDVVDHDNRVRNEKLNDFQEPIFPKIEAVILLGEPKRWESALQILADVLLTGGRPNGPRLPVADVRLPVVACNMDLEFKDRAPTPRFGHGAFLSCLESLYQKLTGRALEYEALVGKPSEITFRFAEHLLNEERKRLGFTRPLQKMYLIGDTPDVDIVGSNLYQQYIDRRINSYSSIHHSDNNVISNDDIISNYDANTADLLPKLCQRDAELFCEQRDSQLPLSRNVPSSARLYYPTVTSMQSILVCTGVYRPSQTSEPLVNHAAAPHHGHRDFPDGVDLKKPTQICQDVSEAISFIIQQEDLSC